MLGAGFLPFALAAAGFFAAPALAEVALGAAAADFRPTFSRERGEADF